MPELALLGGSPVIDRSSWPIWPEVSPDDEKAVVKALREGDFTASKPNGSVGQLERRWAEITGTRHCVGVSNGTAAISLALAALGVGAGDEVIVPALSFIASALAIVHIGAIPVFADIDPFSFNLLPSELARRITDRTKAVVVVHLHGLPADMDEILDISRAAGIAVIEDAAQAHGAVYRGKCVGGLGDAGTFSLSISKNLPTCGEGGLVTTGSDKTARKIRMLRQFGEDLVPGKIRTYEHLDVGWNNKMSAVQGAFTLSQLDRFQISNEKRQSQTRTFLDKLSRIPGIVCPTHPDDRSHVWHILRFRIDPVKAGIPDVDAASFRLALQKVLNAEGCPMREYQIMPLAAQSIFANTFAGTWAERLAGGHRYSFSENDLPNTCAVVSDSFVLQKFQQVPDSEGILDQCVEAFDKAFRNLDFVVDLARTRPFRPPWRVRQ